MIQDKAIQTIYNAITPHGILASTNDIGNYARIWSRDAMMTGITGLLLDDATIIAAHKCSIITLANAQASTGQIPSNVKLEGTKIDVSFGTLVGRVDATTWWLIGTLSYIILQKDDALLHELQPKIEKAFAILQNWEFNNRGLLYTPLGGNWADEYTCDGYTLYDNCLRLWALQLVQKAMPSDANKANHAAAKELLQNNFTITAQAKERYHFLAYEKLLQNKKPYLPSSLNANGYQTKWDMAGNAIALLMGINNDVKATSAFLHHLQQQQQHWMLPVFYPIITPQDNEWHLLENNYNYVFKNKPHHFHNGGSWPIFLGWLSMGLVINQETQIPAAILTQYQQILQADQSIHFQEYISTNEMQTSGTDNLCFSAAGLLLMQLAANQSLNKMKQLL
jgi:Alkaline and neutral invertase